MDSQPATNASVAYGQEQAAPSHYFQSADAGHSVDDASDLSPGLIFASATRPSLGRLPEEYNIASDEDEQSVASSSAPPYRPVPVAGVGKKNIFSNV